MKLLQFAVKKQGDMLHTAMLKEGILETTFSHSMPDDGQNATYNDIADHIEAEVSGQDMLVTITVEILSAADIEKAKSTDAK